MCISKSFYLLVCLLLCSTLFSFAQVREHPLFLNHLTTQDGLTSQNYNDFIYQDSKGFVWISSVDGLNRFDGKRVKNYTADPSDATALNNNTIYSGFFEDDSTNIWFSTPLGIQLYDRVKDEFRSIPLGVTTSVGESRGQDQIQILFLDKKNQEIWVRLNSEVYIKKISTKEKKARRLGRFSFNRLMQVLPSPLSKKAFMLVVPSNEHLFIHHFAPDESDRGMEAFEIDTIYLGSRPKIIFPDAQKTLWIGTESKMFAYDLEEEQKKELVNGPQNVKGIAEGDDGQLWVGTEEGQLFLFDKNRHEFSSSLRWVDEQQIREFRFKIGSLNFFQDHTLWIASPGKGVFYTSLKKRKFSAFLQNNENSAAAYSNIKYMDMDPQGRIWCLSNGGVSVIYPNGNKETDYDLKNNEILNPGNNFFFHILCDRSGGVWVSSQWGLYHLSSIEAGFKQVDQRLFSMVYELADGTLLGAASAGIVELNSSLSDQKEAPVWDFTKENFYNYIYEDNKGHVYLAEMATKMIVVDRSSKKAPTIIGEQSFFPQITDIIEDVQAGQLWIGTKEGLFYLSLDNENEEVNIRRDALNRSLAVNSLQQQDSVLWLSTSNGLIKYDTLSGTNDRYSLADGLQDVEFNFGSSLKLPNGLLAFGGTNGLNIFDPEEIRPSVSAARPVITGIKIENQRLGEQELSCSSTGTTNPGLVESLSLSHSQNTIELDFAALEYSDPNALRFQYRLLGQDKDWIRSEEEQSVRYAGLSPGKYTFELRAVNSDGQVSTEVKQLAIRIAPPVYWNPYAWLFYGLIVLGGIYYYYRTRLARALELAEARKWKELNVFKNRFISNLTHELKTPLTNLTLAVGELFKDKEEERMDVLQSLEEMKQIINRILGLAKLENKTLVLTQVKGDITQFVKREVDYYASFAGMENIKLYFEKEMDRLIMDFDPEKIKDIIRNLLSNAIKYTHPGGKIKLSIKKGVEGQLQLIVHDTGVGISEEDLEKIFDRYYQVKDSLYNKAESTGIGLAYLKELLSFLGGSIQAQSKLGEGATFIVNLPIHNELDTPLVGMFSEQPGVFSKPQKREEEDIPGPTDEHAAEKMNLLLVEDDVKILRKLISLLKNEYNIISAMDGQKGLKMAVETVPDIIVSDVRMPVMDGFELCEHLKNSKTTSHIPIILLTAMIEQKHKFKGLRKRADDYLGKPFDIEELKIRMKNLIEMRRLIWESFNEQSFEENPMVVNENPESNFLNDFKKVILTDPKISVEGLGKKLGLDRNQLYNKVRGLTGLSSQKLASKIKMEWARDLLADPKKDLNVSEVADKVGYSDLGNFSRNFREFFGYSPSDLRR